MEQPHIHEGGCLCGAVRYRIAGEPTALVLCHCRSCRRAAGAPSLAWAIFRAADFSLTRGEPSRYASSPGVERTFCGNCGTSLGYIDAGRPDVMDVTTASLDNPDRFAPDREIWLEEKIAWQTLLANVPHYPRSSKTSQPLP